MSIGNQFANQNLAVEPFILFTLCARSDRVSLSKNPVALSVTPSLCNNTIFDKVVANNIANISDWFRSSYIQSFQTLHRVICGTICIGFLAFQVSILFICGMLCQPTLLCA